MRISLQTQKYLLLALLFIGVMGSVFFCVKFQMLEILALPFLGVFVLQLLYNYKPIYYLLMAAIPLSMPLSLGSFATDFPSEPLMWLFTLLFLIELFRANIINTRKPIRGFQILILLLLIWTLFTTINSAYLFRSIKFFLAKFWYIAAFVYMASKIITDTATIKRMFWWFWLPIFVLILITTVRHSAGGFTFESSNSVMQPYFLNHVIYGAILVVALPFLWYARTWYKTGTPARIFLNISVFVIYMGIALSYGRAAWACGLLLPILAFMVQRKLLEKGIYIGLGVVVLLVAYMLTNNNYYKYAPNYKTTIAFHDDISGHIQATFEGNELSSMERFYRWVAAKNMVLEKPITGFGPSTFNQVYKRYAEMAFETYVSDNEEESTTHNYFLMTFAEQGFVGSFLFVFLCFFMMIKGARLYHKLKNPEWKSIVMASVICLGIIVFQDLLNELIEVDKVGAMFWLSMVFIHKIEIWHEQEEGQA